MPHLNYLVHCERQKRDNTRVVIPPGLAEESNPSLAQRVTKESPRSLRGVPPIPRKESKKSQKTSDF